MVVSDASVLIYLMKVNHLELLGQVYREVAVTDVVFAEVAVDPEEGVRIAEAEFIKIADRSSYDQWLDSLDIPDFHAGERTSIGLCLATEKESLLLADDSIARRVAKENGINVTGFLGVLKVAKATGLLSSVKPLADAAIAAGYRISPGLYRNYLHGLDE